MSGDIKAEIIKRITLLRFPLMVMVVFWHAYPTPVRTSFAVLSKGIEGHLRVITDLLALLVRVSVPLFFAMSGFLFFRNYENTFLVYKQKITRRIRTLFVPHVVWNGFVLILFAVGRNWELTAKFFAHRSVPRGIFGLIDAILGITRQPIAYQFWFLRDLMLLVVFSPLIYFFLKRTKWMGVAVLFVGLMLLGVDKSLRPRLDALAAYSLGGYLALEQVDITKLDSKWKWCLLIYMGLVGVNLTISYQSSDSLIYRIVFFAQVAIGMLLWVLVAGQWQNSAFVTEWLKRLGRGAFFLYAAHEPLLSFVEKVGYLLLPTNSDWVKLILYFLFPTVVIVICYLGYGLLKNCCPGLLMVVTGGRA